MPKVKGVHLVLYKNYKMEYKVKEFTIKELVNLIDNDLINLNPDYQRNYIWTPNDQKSLIDTIIHGYPLPSFFIYLDKKGNYEMVDGQQRSKTIFRFIKGLITSSKSTGVKSFKDFEPEVILSYKLPFIVIENLSPNDNLRDFYVLINKKGVHLNVPEVNKSEHFDKLFLKLANAVLDYQNLIDLNLFTDISIKRMNDRAYIEELLGYLKLGIKEKKKAVENIYKEDINEDEYNELKNSFYEIIDKISILNEIRPIRDTRYKQKNDFYTLFSFINENIDSSQELLNYQYKVLLVLDSIDKEGRQFIRPTNEDCDALKDYANYCVSQSNSTNAREGRLKFFNSVLKNIDVEKNESLIDVLNFLSEIFGEESIQLKDIEEYQLLDIEQLN
jgi:uncharacterized protein with ParB-like and HNH nuclease domain